MANSDKQNHLSSLSGLIYCMVFKGNTNYFLYLLSSFMIHSKFWLAYFGAQIILRGGRGDRDRYESTPNHIVKLNLSTLTFAKTTSIA